VGIWWVVQVVPVPGKGVGVAVMVAVGAPGVDVTTTVTGPAEADGLKVCPQDEMKITDPAKTAETIKAGHLNFIKLFFIKPSVGFPLWNRTHFLWNRL
jgi:hypothetical protein